MTMSFFTAYDTPLFSSAWTPRSTGQYAGACIFLIVLAVISRMISVLRFKFEEKKHDQATKRRYIVVAGADGKPEDRLSDTVRAKGESGVLTSRGVDENVVISTQAKSREGTPWRLSVDLPRALIHVVQAGVGYLL